MKPEKTVYVLRGLPGCGKTNLSMMLWNTLGASTCSADYLFEKDDGYEFDITLLGEAHAQCKRDFKTFIEREDLIIVVDNTNTKYWEFKWFISYAKKHGYKVIVLTVENYHNGESIHDVPLEKIEQMRDRFEISL